MTTGVLPQPAALSRPWRPAAARVISGVFLLAAGGLGLVAVTVPGRARTPGDGWSLSWRYPPDTLIWAAILMALGVVLALGWRRRWAAQIAAASAVIALMLAGQAGVGIRDWFNVAGAGSISLSSLANVVTIAAACSVISLAAAATAAVTVWPQIHPGAGVTRRGPLLASAVVAVAVPVVPFLALGEPVTVTGFGSVFLPWALPWAAGLLAAAFAAKPVARTLIWSVAAAAMCTVLLFVAAIMNAR